MARAKIQDSALSKGWWAEAVVIAAYIRNRIPCSSKQEPDKTLYEEWMQEQPYLRNFRIFGSNCYMHIPKEI
jgi:hypothetical protein